MKLGIGKLVGKVLGEVAVSPLTIAAEVLEAAEETVEQAGKAINRVYGDEDEKP